MSWHKCTWYTSIQPTAESTQHQNPTTPTPPPTLYPASSQVITVDMAGVTGGMGDVDLEVGGQAVRVVAAGKQPLLVDLPFELNADMTKAKVSRHAYTSCVVPIYYAHDIHQIITRG